MTFFRCFQFFACLCILIEFKPCAAQNKERADSLLNYLKKESLDNSTRLSILYEVTKSLPEPDDQIHYANLLLELALDNKNDDFLSKAYHLLGVANRFKGNLHKGLQYLFNSGEIAIKLGDKEMLAKTYVEIASCYSSNSDTKNALEYNRKAINIFRDLGGGQQLAINLLNTGFDFYSLDELDSARKFYDEAEPIFDEIGLKIGKAYTIGNRALVYWKQGNLFKAESDLLSAIKILKSLGDQFGIADYNNQLARIYYQQGRLEEAIDFSTKSLAISEEVDLKEQARDAYKTLFEAFRKKAEFDKALEYHLSYLAYRDSIQNQETVKRMADLRTEYEVGQKQAEVDLLTIEKRNQQFMLMATGAFALVLVVLAMIIFKYYRDRNRTAHLLARQKDELESLNQTKDKFFSIISHDLRGPVSSFMGVSYMIRHFVQSKDTSQLLEVADDIDNSVKRLSALLDNLLTWAMQQQGHFPHVPEKLNFSEMADELVQTLDTMASAKHIRLYSAVGDEVILWADRNTTMTIIRNLVSNSLKFTPEHGEVKITAMEQGEFAEIRVSDTGVGIPREKLKALFNLEAKKSTYGTSGEKGLGLGLQLVHEFIEMNGGRIKVDSTEGEGSTFTIWLPLFVQKRSFEEAERVSVKA